MELALNLAWLVVTALLLLLCGARALSFPDKRRRIIAVMALACLIWLLFPIISITDDLNAGQFVFQASATREATQLTDPAPALPSPPVAVSAPCQSAWRETNLHADLCDITQESFAFDLRRRPPPQL